MVVITPLPGVRPMALLQEIAIGLGAYVGQNKTSILRSILYTLLHSASAQDPPGALRG